MGDIGQNLMLCSAVKSLKIPTSSLQGQDSIRSPHFKTIGLRFSDVEERSGPQAEHFQKKLKIKKLHKPGSPHT